MKRSPTQLASNVAVTSKLLTSKIGAVAHRYEVTMKRTDFLDKYLTPEAKRVIARWAGGGGPAASGIGAAGTRIKDPKTGRTGTFRGTPEEAKKAGYEVLP
jgi:hypothetical protein